MMPGEDGLESLGHEHVERLAEPEEHEGRGRVRKEARGVVLDDRTPIEEVPRAAAAGSDLDRARRGADDAQPGRQHQTLLAARERDVDPPLVEAEVHAAKRADRIDDEKRIALLR